MPAIQAKPKAIIVCGPTGIGKTAFAISLARFFKGEIIGADSMQIYRKMDIGTAKPTPQERSQVRHHLVDIIDPDVPFDAETYACRALAVINALQEKQVVPFVVGGTGLYIKALVNGLFDAPPVDPAIRKRLARIVEKEGSAPLFERLKRLDPDTARKLHANDTYRIMRALEVFESTGRSISDFHHQHQFQERQVDALKLGLHMQRDRLYRRIDRRVDKMMAGGFLAEVKHLLDSGYTEEMKSMQSIGYRHLSDYLEGRLEWSEAVRTLKRDTRRYAKRQMTWFGADEEIVWVDPGMISEARDAIENFLSKPAEGVFA